MIPYPWASVKSVDFVVGYDLIWKSWDLEHLKILHLLPLSPEFEVGISLFFYNASSIDRHVVVLYCMKIISMLGLFENHEGEPRVGCLKMGLLSLMVIWTNWGVNLYIIVEWRKSPNLLLWISLHNWFGKFWKERYWFYEMKKGFWNWKILEVDLGNG